MLLAALDQDRERAGELYLVLRQKLTDYFRARACWCPDYYTDETMDRAALRLQLGAVVPDLENYCYGIARLLLFEMWRERKREREAAEHLRLSSATQERGEDAEYLFARLDDAVRSLPARDRDLVMGYYGSEDNEKLVGRRDLAARYGLRPNALRIRVHRARKLLRQRFEQPSGSVGR